ncbi:MAG: hypothetical protein BTM30_09725 [Synechococcus lacustris str. Tous]|nr:MAG: hypothetical protein BTM30_09725 [Synechococcus lacustris str. Tous]
MLAVEALAAKVNCNSCGDAFLKDGRTQRGVHTLTQARKVNGALQQQLEFLFEVHRREGYEGVMAPIALSKYLLKRPQWQQSSNDIPYR